MKIITTKNEVYKGSSFESWEEVIDFIRENLYMNEEPYEFKYIVSQTTPESIQISLYEEFTDNDEEYEPIFKMKMFIYLDKENSLEDLLELWINLLNWLKNLRGVYNDYCLDEYSILYKTDKYTTELFKYQELQEE